MTLRIDGMIILNCRPRKFNRLTTMSVQNPPKPHPDAEAAEKYWREKMHVDPGQLEARVETKIAMFFSFVCPPDLAIGSQPGADAGPLEVGFCFILKKLQALIYSFGAKLKEYAEKFGILDIYADLEAPTDSSNTIKKHADFLKSFSAGEQCDEAVTFSAEVENAMDAMSGGGETAERGWRDRGGGETAERGEGERRTKPGLAGSRHPPARHTLGATLLARGSAGPGEDSTIDDLCEGVKKPWSGENEKTTA